MLAPDTLTGDIVLTDADFAAIVVMVRQQSGIVLGHSKRDLVYGRLRRRLRSLNIESFALYREMLDAEGGQAERVRMINAITTNLTGFFREPHHFEFLGKQVLAQLPRDRNRLRIWSAGCSSGEEPYSIAMTLCNAMPDLGTWDARILATDIDTDMIAHGASGRYSAERAAAIPAGFLARHARQRDATITEMGPQLRSLITFKPLNLLGPWPMTGSFDVIFCRNVVIYFDKDTQRSLFDRFADQLVLGGYLFVGHSESLFRVTERFEHLGRTIYRKVR
ncbi:CheR family methyltransferase [Lichenicola sp.]|uniref:CheR family methyltransferase n=1 Tax=Lichenicola sp. TaxID=2804529 RepID=UPI003B00A441